MHLSQFGRKLIFITATKTCLPVSRHWTIPKMKNSVGLYAKMYSTKPALDVNQIISTYFDDFRHKNLEILLEPCKYIWSTPAVNINNDLIDSLNIWMKVPQDKIKIIKEVTWLYYSYINLSDDVMDDSPTRKGLPTAHNIFGVNRTLLAAEALIMQALQKLAAVNNPEAFKNFTTKMIEYHASIARHFYQKDNLIRRTREECFLLSLGIDAGFYSSILAMMQAFSNCKTDFTRLIAIFGFLARVLNDTSNVERNEFRNIKYFAEDISQGAHTLPVILAGERKTLESETILNIVNLSTSDELLKNYCVDLIEKLGILEECKDLEAYLYQNLMDEVNKLGGNPDLVNIVKKFQKWKNDEVFNAHTLYKSETKEIS